MLSKKQRLPRKLFGPILVSKSFFNTPHFSLRWAGAQEVRVAASVSKKVSKKAVDRNRVRRRIYSTVNQFFSQLKPGLYLVSSKPGSLKLKGEELRKELLELFSERVD